MSGVRISPNQTNQRGLSCIFMESSLKFTLRSVEEEKASPYYLMVGAVPGLREIAYFTLAAHTVDYPVFSSTPSPRHSLHRTFPKYKFIRSLTPLYWTSM